MGKRVGFRQFLDCLDSNRQHYALLKAAGGACLVVTRYGGRIFGPFFDADAESALWTSPAFDRKEDFAALVANRGWNPGGDRVWISPELQYNVRDRTRFHETYDLPGQIDPGNYELASLSESGCSLSEDITVRLHNPKGREKRLRLERRITLAADPLASASLPRSVRDSLRYAGYAHEVTLVDQHPDDLLSQTWSITQVPNGGVVIIPTTADPDFADHWHPADPVHLKVEERCMKLRMLGDCMIKIGLKAASHFGRSGYYRVTGRGQAALTVRLFFNNPSETYLAEAPHTPGVRGYSYEVYHDDGNLGSFGELECYGRPIGGDTGRDRCTDEFANWFYVGEEAAVKRAARVLLGVDV